MNSRWIKWELLKNQAGRLWRESYDWSIEKELTNPAGYVKETTIATLESVNLMQIPWLGAIKLGENKF